MRVELEFTNCNDYIKRVFICKTAIPLTIKNDTCLTKGNFVIENYKELSSKKISAIFKSVGELLEHDTDEVILNVS